MKVYKVWKQVMAALGVAAVIAVTIAGHRFAHPAGTEETPKGQASKYIVGGILPPPELKAPNPDTQSTPTPTVQP